MLYLLIREEGAEREVVIKEGTSRVGRLSSNDIVVRSEDVSREHAELRVANGALEVRDLGTSNGSFVEGGSHRGARPQPLPQHEWQRVSVGDAVRLGSSCRLELRQTLGMHVFPDLPLAPGAVADGRVGTLVPDHPSTRLVQALAVLASRLPSIGHAAPAWEEALEAFCESTPGVLSALVVVRDAGSLRVLACTASNGAGAGQAPALPVALAEETLQAGSDGVLWAEGGLDAPASLACRGDEATALVLGLDPALGAPAGEVVAATRIAARLIAAVVSAPAPGVALRPPDRVESRGAPATDVASLFPGVIPSASFRSLLEQSAKVAGGTGPILVAGETGVGKELIARFLHAASARKGPFVEASVGALSPALVESELFGHVKGAFTDATCQRPGLLEQAHRGTLFLDEIGEVPLVVQHKLLRALQERTFRRVGSNETCAFDALVVAATNRDLAAEVAAGRFREDLYYRLNMMEVSVPPLRERPGDIAILADCILRELGSGRSLDVRALDWLVRRPWPGNVRQLRNVLERAVRLHDASVLRPEHLDARDGTSHDMKLQGCPLDWREALTAFERAWCEVIWGASGGKMSEAARLSGLDRSNIRRRLRDHGVGGVTGGDDDTLI